MKLLHRKLRSAGGSAGFTLLETMVAIAILAIALLAITSAQSSSLHNGMRVYRGQVAALIIRGIVLDVEEEYLREGFPENSVTDRECEVPDDFDEFFQCRYDLERMDLEATEMTQLVDQSFGGLLGEGGLGALAGGGDMNSTMTGIMDGTTSLGGGMDLAGLAFLMPFMGPDGQALMDLCNVNLNGLIMGLMGMQAVVPQILQQVSDRTRKLRVVLSWQDGPMHDREFEIVTFVSALPEAELKALKEVEDAKEVMENSGMLPTLEEGGPTKTPQGGGR